MGRIFKRDGLIAVVWIVIFLMLIPIGCSREKEKSQKTRAKTEAKVGKEKVIKIGAILPLTGSASVLGKFIKTGIDVAVKILNGGEGRNKKKFKVIYGDSRNNPREGISICHEFINTRKLPVIISAMSSVSNALVPIVDKNSTVLFATAVSAAHFPAQSPWVFRLFITADVDAKTAAEFAFKKLKKRKAVIIYVEDDFGRSFKEVFTNTFRHLGGKVASTEGFAKGARDFRSLVARIKNVNADIIYLLGYDKHLGILIKQLREQKINLPLLSIATISQPYVVQQAGKAIEETYFTSVMFDPDHPQTQRAKEFIEIYQKIYKKKPNYFSAFAFDTIMIIAKAIQKVGTDPDKIRKALLSIKNYEGVTAIISFDNTGDAFFPMVVKMIKEGKIINVED